MQFIPLVNFEAYQRAAVNGSNKQFTDTSGTGHNIYSGANASNYVPFILVLAHIPPQAYIIRFPMRPRQQKFRMTQQQYLNK